MQFINLPFPLNFTLRGFFSVFPIVFDSLTSDSSSAHEEYYATTGVSSSIHEATKEAVKHMIEFMCYHFGDEGMDRVKAYMLCSVVGDLKMHEVVSLLVLLYPWQRVSLAADMG
jgi:acetamidase/formamidase